MNFDDIKRAIKGHCNLTSQEADTRVGETINRHHRRITAELGLDSTRFVTRTVTTTNGVRTVEFEEIEKIDRVLDTTDSSNIRLLHEVSVHEQRSTQPSAGSPCTWAPQESGSSSVTVLLDTVPQTTYTLQADGRAALADLQGDDSPVFPESYHDILTWYGISEELLRKEKLQAAAAFEQKANKLLAELRHFLADSHTRDDRQGRHAITSLAGSSSGGGGGTLGATAYTQSALVTFDLGSGIAPFAVAQANAATVTNLDADKLDGEDSAYYLDRANHTGSSLHASEHENGGADEIDVTGLSGLLADSQNPLAHKTSHQSGGTDAIKIDDLSAPDDNTDLDASTTAHGLLKKLSGVATQFLNGAGNFAALATADLPTSAVRVADALTAVATFSNTSAEQDLYTVAIAGNSMGTSRKLRFSAFVIVVTDTGGARNVNLRVKFGGVTQLSGNIQFGVNTSNYVHLMVEIANLGSASVQKIIGTTTSASTGGGATWTAINTTSTTVAGVTGAVDTTSAQDFKITAQMDNADPAFTTAMHAGVLELV